MTNTYLTPVLMIQRQSVFTSSRIKEFLACFESSSKDMDLIIYLRSLEIVNHKNSKRGRDIEDDLHLLNGIIDTFNNNYKADIFNKIINNTPTSDIEDWRINCYTLSIAFLSKLKEKSTNQKVVKYILQSLDELSQYSNNNTSLMTVIEIFLFALNNIIKNIDVKTVGKLNHDFKVDYNDIFDVNAVEKLNQYFRQNQKEIIKWLSAYLLGYLINRIKASMIKEDDLIHIAEYLNLKFEEFENNKSIKFMGFVWGPSEKCEIEKAIVEIRRTRLLDACRGGRTDIVRILLEQGSLIESGDNDGLTGLHYACIKGHTDIVRILLDGGSNIESGDKNGQTGLHYACLGGQTDIVRILLERGSNIECRDKYEWTGLHYATHWGHSDIVRMLLERGSDIECRDKYGWTGLHHARQWGHSDIVRMLLERGSDILSVKS